MSTLGLVALKAHLLFPSFHSWFHNLDHTNSSNYTEMHATNKCAKYISKILLLQSGHMALVRALIKAHTQEVVTVERVVKAVR